MKIAYFCEPQVGGTFTFFLQLRETLLKCGMDFRCIPPLARSHFAGKPQAKQDGMDFIELADDLPRAIGQTVEHLRLGSYDVVMTLPGTHALCLNLPRYLPRSMRCLARATHNARGVYKPIQMIAPHLDGVVAVSHRLASDLSSGYGIPPGQVTTIYHGVDTNEFPFVERSTEGPCRILYLGRIEDYQKNILILPRVLQQVVASGLSVHLSLVGHGPDTERLRAEFVARYLSDFVTFVGAVPRSEVPRHAGAADVLILPSRFEGCGFSLIECMSTGCVPVVSHIAGIFDRIVEDGVSGFVRPVDDVSGFAKAIIELGCDRERLRRMSQAARLTVEQRFTIERMAANYAGLFRKCVDTADHRVPVLTAGRDSPLLARPSLLGRILPSGMKNWLRTKLERMGRSV